MHFDRDWSGSAAFLRKRLARRRRTLVLLRAQFLIEILEHAGGVFEQAGAAHRIAQIVHLCCQRRLIARQIADQLIDLDHHHGRETERDRQRAGGGAHHRQPPRQPPALQKSDQRRKQDAEQDGECDGDKDIAGEIEGGDDDRQNDEIRKREACRNDQVRSPASSNWADPPASFPIGGECSKCAGPVVTHRLASANRAAGRLVCAYRGFLPVRRSE